MNVRIPRNAVNFLTSGGTASFSEGSVQNEVVVSHCICTVFGWQKACSVVQREATDEAGLLYVIE
jgi:hypothetical protein